MATAPKMFRPAGMAHSETRRERQERIDTRRGSAASRGYNAEWRRFRVAHLMQHPLCVMCLAEGVVTPATIVDHIDPPKGDMELFWRAGNHQSLCKPHHDRKTVLEDGGLGGGVNWHPPFLLPSRVPLTIVCGAPLAGKSRWIEGQRQPGDVLIDLDEIGAALCGTGLHDWPRARLNDAGRERNRQLLRLSGQCDAPRVWFVVQEPEAQWRQWWADTMQPERIVVIETPRHVCERRAIAERERAGDVAIAIDTWWQRYTRRPGDEIVRHAGD